MKFSPPLSSLALVLAAGSLLAGSTDTKPDMRIVIAPQTEVRAGPSFSSECYVTNILRRAEAVEVIHDAGNGWLAIKPPRGSFSWIDTRHVQQVAPGLPNYMVTVEGAGAPVLVGSEPNKYRYPTKVNAHLVKGSQVRRTGPELKNQTSEGTIICIEPPAAELRYIRADQVGRGQQVNLMAASMGMGGFTTVSQSSPGEGAAQPIRAPDPDALWRQADLAERKGRLREAIQLYKQAGAANSGVNAARSREAFDRAQYLEDVLSRPQSQGGLVPGPRAAAAPRVPPAAQTAGFTTPVAYIAPPAAAQASTTQQAALRTPMAPADPSLQVWTGKLRPSGRPPRWGATRGFALDTQSKEAPVIELEPKGVDLLGYVGKEVEVSGSFEYNKDLRHYVMKVVHVRPVS
jgi:hypothetical protein